LWKGCAMDKQGQGFLTIAQNTATVDYLTLAYVQAMNIKSLHPGAKCAVIVDNETYSKITHKHDRTFDFVIKLPYDENPTDSSWKLLNEYQACNLSPFKETIKLESDLLFTRNIDHWWDAFRFRDVVLSSGCKTYRQVASTSKAYRKFFVDNDLPDTYNGLMYFRYSQTAYEFFNLAKEILYSWDQLKVSVLKNCREDKPSTDVLYALTAKLYGVEKCTIPTMDFINFVHLKPAINGWGTADFPWHHMVMSERDGDMIRVNNLNQYHPVHYHDKNYITQDIIDYYERLF